MPGPSQNVNLPGAGSWNLPFHPRLVGYGSIGTEDSRGRGPTGREVSVKRGYIRTRPDYLDGDGASKPSRWLYFLYNPATVSTSYSVQLEGPSAARAMDPSNPASVISELDQSLSFSLLFDRTYEVMEGSKEGAWRDVRAALAVGGVLKSVDESAIYTTESDFETGPLVFTPMVFHFGNQVGGLSYFGYLTSMSIEYTHFSKDMIPMRVGMHMSARLLQAPAGGPAIPSREAGTTPADNTEGPIYGPFVPNEANPNYSVLDELEPYMDRSSTSSWRIWDN